MELTRRELPALLAGAATALGQAGGAPEPSEDLLKAATRRLQRNAEAVRKFAVPMETEPAFAFKAQGNA